MARTASKSKSKNSKEMNNAIKAFKASEEVEEFYKYVLESDLRAETGILLKYVLSHTKGKRKKRTLH